MPAPSPEPDTGPPLRDPFSGVSGAPPRKSKSPLLFAVVAACLTGAGVFLFGVSTWLSAPPAPPPSVITVRSTPNVLIAVRDLARLETAQVHVEKVIDLTDTQSRLFGLVEAQDAILLVAVGEATLGVDLSKLTEGDISMDATSKTAYLRLPAPELLSAGLDEKATYVYTRSTSVLARRNEQLESKARREAVEAIRRAALAPDMLTRARTQAERQIRALVTQLGAEKVEITWRE